MNTFTKDDTNETGVLADRASVGAEGKPVRGTIAVGLGSMEERQEDAAVDAHLASTKGPALPPSLVRKERRQIGSAVRDFWHDETSLPIANPDKIEEEERRQRRLAVLAAAALASLILLFLSERGSLDPWLQKVFG